MDAERQFAQASEAQLRDPRVSLGKMFGSQGLKVNGKVFAMLVKGKLVVKLPRARVDALVSAGQGEYFDPGHGRLMKEWVALKPRIRDEWSGLVEEAKKMVQPSEASS